MTKFFNKSKKPSFRLIFVHFPNFWDKKIFPENPALSRTTSYGFVEPYQNLEKTERRKDGETLFYKTLLATAGGLKTSFRPPNSLFGCNSYNLPKMKNCYKT